VLNNLRVKGPTAPGLGSHGMKLFRQKAALPGGSSTASSQHCRAAPAPAVAVPIVRAADVFLLLTWCGLAPQVTSGSQLDCKAGSCQSTSSCQPASPALPCSYTIPCCFSDSPSFLPLVCPLFWPWTSAIGRQGCLSYCSCSRASRSGLMPGVPHALRLLAGHPFGQAAGDTNASQMLTQLAAEHQLQPAQVMSGRTCRLSRSVSLQQPGQSRPVQPASETRLIIFPLF